ncbi:hypothetical protein AB0H43_18590 [Hamadaea sp. NPDC050747]|uniref:hypothetical protein n=1 Tax=Hamadaea sp. NPDC050747 TaxID=3155789 RepID=UPI003403D6DE
MDLPADLRSSQPAESRPPRVWGWGAWSVLGTLGVLAAGCVWITWRAAEGRVDWILGVTLVALGGAVLAIWLRNLVRWGLGVLLDAQRVQAELCAGGTAGMDLVFLTFTWRGRLRYQQVVWEPWIPELPSAPEILVRRCPGLQAMFVVDIPGRGRLWPSRAAHGRPPWRVPVGPAGFRTSPLGWGSVLLWSAPSQTILALQYGPATLAVTLPLQAALLLMLGVAFSGVASES